MKALGDKRPDEQENTKKKRRIGFAPGAKAVPVVQQPENQENFDESVEL